MKNWGKVIKSRADKDHEIAHKLCVFSGSCCCAAPFWVVVQPKLAQVIEVSGLNLSPVFNG